jgi:hypothetical protein
VVTEAGKVAGMVTWMALCKAIVSPRPDSGREGVSYSHGAIFGAKDLEFAPIGAVRLQGGHRCSIIWRVIEASQRRSFSVPTLPQYIIEPIWEQDPRSATKEKGGSPFRLPQAARTGQGDLREATGDPDIRLCL